MRCQERQSVFVPATDNKHHHEKKHKKRGPPHMERREGVGGAKLRAEK